VTLTRCSDLSPADWLTTSDQPWEQLVTVGPAGFAAYARLRFLPDPAYEGQSENDVGLAEDTPSETAQLSVVLDVLSGFTRTPDDCYFCLWDGWGDHVHDSDGGSAPDLRTDTVGAEPGVDPSGRYRPVPAIDPTFRPSVSRESMVVVPNRAYFLYRGSVTDLGASGSSPAWPGQLGAGRADPAFIWPADRTWCVANDVDPHWAGIGAAAPAIDQLIADPRLDVVRADPRGRQPHYR
jgi:hypothetical protein